MKYFTKDLWRMVQDDRSMDKAEELWRNAYSVYMAELRLARSSVSEKLYTCLSNGLFHGCNIVDIGAEYSGVMYRQTPPTSYMYVHGKRGKTSVGITLFSPQGLVYRLRYARVDSYTFDFSTKDRLGFEDGPGQDTWGYDELTKTPSGLRHDILLHSGATVGIGCQRIYMKQRRTDTSRAAIPLASLR
jgi:hypothetical protein